MLVHRKLLKIQSLLLKLLIQSLLLRLLLLLPLLILLLLILPLLILPLLQNNSANVRFTDKKNSKRLQNLLLFFYTYPTLSPYTFVTLCTSHSRTDTVQRLPHSSLRWDPHTIYFQLHRSAEASTSQLV